MGRFVARERRGGARAATAAVSTNPLAKAMRRESRSHDRHRWRNEERSNILRTANTTSWAKVWLPAVVAQGGTTRTSRGGSTTEGGEGRRLAFAPRPGRPRQLRDDAPTFEGDDGVATFGLAGPVRDEQHAARSGRRQDVAEQLVGQWRRRGRPWARRARAPTRRRGAPGLRPTVAAHRLRRSLPRLPTGSRARKEGWPPTRSWAASSAASTSCSVASGRPKVTLECTVPAKSWALWSTSAQAARTSDCGEPGHRDAPPR